MAPLVDCVFLLLIFFLLTSTFSARRGLRIELPGASTAEAADRERIEVELAATGEVAVAGSVVAPEEVEGALRARAAGGRAKVVFLIADRRASVEALALVTDAARRAGLARLVIATRSEDAR